VAAPAVKLLSTIVGLIPAWLTKLCSPHDLHSDLFNGEIMNGIKFGVSYDNKLFFVYENHCNNSNTTTVQGNLAKLITNN